jgi:hypothetical protein
VPHAPTFHFPQNKLACFLGLGLRLSPAPRKPSAEAPFEIFHEVGRTQEILL